MKEDIMLDFRLLTFMKLCELKSYTKTAEYLHMTQPTVTLCVVNRCDPFLLKNKVKV